MRCLMQKYDDIAYIRANNQYIRHYVWRILTIKQREQLFDVLSPEMGSYHNYTSVFCEKLLHRYSKYQQLRLMSKLKFLPYIHSFEVLGNQIVMVGVDKSILFTIRGLDDAPRAHHLMSESMSTELNEAIRRLDVYHKTDYSSMMDCINYHFQVYVPDHLPRNFHIRKNGEMTFLPAGRKAEMSDNNNWLPHNRQVTKIGKGIKQMLKSGKFNEVFKDQHLEFVTNQIKANHTFTGTIKEVSGKDINKYYHYSSYADNQHTLSASCMKHDSCQSYIDFYSNNPECSMVIALNDEDKLIGRAILWHNVNFINTSDIPEDAKLMDRAYGKPLTVNSLIAYAKSKGYITKTHQDYHSSSEFTLPNGACFEDNITIRCPYTSGQGVPYMDTMKYGELVNGEFLLLDNQNGDMELTGTEGNIFETVTDCNGNEINEDDAHWSDYMSEYIHRDDSVYCERHDTYMHESHVVEIVGSHFAPDDADDISRITTPHGRETYDIDDNVMEGYQDGYCNISDYWPVTTDHVHDTWVYEMNTSEHHLTILYNDETISFTIISVASMEEIDALDINKLYEIYQRIHA